jgi:hypothetical protein
MEGCAPSPEKGEVLMEGQPTDSFSLPPVAALYTPLGDVEEIFNPLGVSLGASES